MERQVSFEPAGRMHPAFLEVYRHPPEGYRFVLPDGAYERVTGRLMRVPFLFYTVHREVLERVVPVHLAKAWLERWTRRPPPGSVLTYAQKHLVFRPEPWVVHIEWPTLLVGYRYRDFLRFRPLVERMLASPWCRAILTWSEEARTAILRNLDPAVVEPKLTLVPLSVAPKPVRRPEPQKGRVRLLFLASSEVGEFDFYLKGGHETLVAFLHLRERYPHLELVMRTPLPAEIRRRYLGAPGLRVIERVIPWEDLEREFLEADLFLCPAHATPWRSLLDAMSYGLPVVTSDICANPEIVEDGVTGLVLPKDERVPFYADRERRVPIRHTGLRKQNERALRRLDEGMVRLLVERLPRLIEDADLRRRMGERARQEVEAGRFSLRRRNAILKAVFDRALEAPSPGGGRG